MDIYIQGTLVDVARQLNRDEPLYFDTETAGLYGKVCLAQFYQKSWVTVILVRYPEPIELMSLLAYCNFGMHNAHYDLTVLQTHGAQQWIPKNFFDTFLLSRLALPSLESYSFDDVLKSIIGFDPYDQAGLIKKDLQKSNWEAKVLTEEQLLYAALDVYYMPDVYDVVQIAIGASSYALDIAALRNALVFQWHGMPVSQERINKKYSENQQVIKEANVPINVNSYVQVRKYLECTESDDEALARMAAEGNEKASKVRLVRKLTKQLSFLNKFQGDRIYGKFKPSARSGRLTSDDQNLQQLPRALKGVFSAPAGRVLVFADYAQLELRTICAIVVCRLMEKLFREGADLHGYTSLFLFGEVADKATAKWNRQVAKGFNFLALYGGGIEMILTVMLKQMNIFLTEAQGIAARRKWRNLWREIYAWQQSGLNKWQRGLLGSTPLGRQYKAKLLTDFLNIENQGAGAEVAKLAMHYFFRDCYHKYTDVFMCNFIHDSYILECEDNPEVYIPLSKDLAKCMQLAWFEMSKCFAIKDLPMPVDVKVGYNWGDIESDDVANVYDYSIDGMHYYEEANN